MEMDENSEDFLKAFLCDDEQTELSQDDVHYVLAFEKFKTGTYINWNFAAFFLGPLNFAYRKNWIAFVVSFFSLGIVLRVVLTLFSDYLYFMKFNDTCKKAEFLTSDREKQRQFIAQKGGKNLVFAIILGLLPLIIVAVVIAIIMFVLSVGAVTGNLFL